MVKVDTRESVIRGGKEEIKKKRKEGKKENLAFLLGFLALASANNE